MRKTAIPVLTDRLAGSDLAGRSRRCLCDKHQPLSFRTRENDDEPPGRAKGQVPELLVGCEDLDVGQAVAPLRRGGYNGDSVGYGPTCSYVQGKDWKNSEADR